MVKGKRSYTNGCSRQALPLRRSYESEFSSPLGNYPNDHSSNWTDNLQGVTHDSEHWYFTQTKKLLKFHVTTDLSGDSDQATAIAWMPDDLVSLGCNHFGDPDYFEWEGQGYLFIPVEGKDCCEQLTFLAVFLNDNNLTYVGSTILPNQQESKNTGRAGWCAISPVNHLLHSSSNEIKADRPVFRYEVNFDALQNGDVVLTPCPDLVLRENNAAQNPVHIAKYVQGGTFSPDGWLYISSGGNSADKDGGIHVFDTEGVLQDRSSLSNMPFKYEFHSGFSKYEEPEGLTYWDIDELRQTMRVPEIEGQLHAILLDNDVVSTDEIYFKHYRVE